MKLIHKCTLNLELENQFTLESPTLAYHTYGILNQQKDNVVWICHALTANSDAQDWWPGMIGEGCVFDTNQYFVICVNNLGSCYGSSGPLNASEQNKYLDFPRIAIRDIAASLELLRLELHLPTIKYLVGGSLGGQIAMEWAYLLQNKVENLILLATNAKHSPWGIAFNESQRMAIEADNTWGQKGAAAQKGLAAARSIALLSYRNYNTYCQTQAEAGNEAQGAFKAISYQRYQGEKLCKRFDAYSYWYLTHAMDSHNMGRGRESVESALSNIQAKTLVIGIESDLLFPICEQQFLAEFIPNSKLEIIQSLYGHDGFLIETKAITEIINKLKN
jgi:homoserine O-acetyltransferase